MLQKIFGDKTVHFDGNHADDALRHMEQHMSHDERQEVFNDAYHRGEAHLNVRLGNGDYKHFVLEHRDGQYSIKT